jgi:hypothetical protein
MGVYRMLVLDGHESHQSVEFETYCKDNNIIHHSCLSTASFFLPNPATRRRTFWPFKESIRQGDRVVHPGPY